MNWKWSNHNKDHFVSFDHQETRLAALEVDLKTLSEDLLAYLEADISCPWMTAAKRLSHTLRGIIKNRESAE
jgi:hypothetical protein